VPKDEHPGVAIEADVAGGAVTVGIVGTVSTVLPVTSGAAGVGINVAELTPRLLISAEPSGIPVLGLPPDVIGVVEGLEDAAMLLEPEPHMPDMPAVSSVPEVGLWVVPDIIDVDEVAAIPDDVSIDAAVFPAVPVAAAEPAIAIPPPS
jgi:hypothetical protein